MDGLSELVGLSTGFHFFLIFYLINRGGQPTASIKAGLTEVGMPTSVKFYVVVKIFF